MDPETIFLPCERKIATITDQDIIKQAVNCYFEINYKGMKGFILEYGEETFFSDLVKYLNSGYWRNPVNKYYTFTGITIAFFKIYN
jgi:hypothetical protein